MIPRQDVTTELRIGSGSRPIVLAGHFEPGAIGAIIGGEAGARLSAFGGPPAVPIHHLAREFVTRGLETTVLGGLRGSAGIEVRSSPLSAIAYRKRGRNAWIWDGLRSERLLVLEYLRNLQPSIVHAHWTLEAARAAADWDGPKVLTVHDAAWEYYRLGRSRNWGPLAHADSLRWLANTSSVLKRFRHIIAVSPFVESYLRLNHRFEGEIRVIPNAIVPLPNNLLVSETFPKATRVTFGVYGSPGRLKNIGAAVEAFLEVRRALPDSRLVVFGVGWQKESLLYSGLPIEFAGALLHHDFLSRLGSEIDIWVHPSRIETHGISICEAIQAGCPVIAGRSSGAVPWTLEYGKAGLLVDIEKPAEIARAMLLLVNNRKLALELVEYGRKMIVERFNAESVIGMHLEYYRDVIGEWNRKAQ